MHVSYVIVTIFSISARHVGKDHHHRQCWQDIQCHWVEGACPNNLHSHLLPYLARLGYCSAQSNYQYGIHYQQPQLYIANSVAGKITSKYVRGNLPYGIMYMQGRLCTRHKMSQIFYPQKEVGVASFQIQNSLISGQYSGM